MVRKEGYDEVDAKVYRHETSIDEDIEIPAGQAAVFAGTLQGTGMITGEGEFAVVGDPGERLRDPLDDSLDFNNFRGYNVGAPQDPNDAARKAETDTNASDISDLQTDKSDVTHRHDGEDITPSSVDTKELNGVVSVPSSENGSGIQAAIDAVNPGGTVKLLGGTFTVSSSIDLDNVSNVTICSEHDAIVQAADALDTSIFNTATNAPVEGVTFDGFILDGNASNQTLADATSFYGIGGLQDAENIILHDMEVRNVINNAVYLAGGDNHRILNSRFYQTGHPNAAKTAAHIVINDGSGHIIKNNEFGRATDNAVYTRNNGTIVANNRFSEVMCYLADSGSHNQYYLYNDIVGTAKAAVTGDVLTNRRWFRFNQNDISEFYVVGNILRGLDADCAGFAEATTDTVTGHQNIHFWNNTIYGGGFADYGILWNSPVDDFSAINNFVTETKRDGIRLNGLNRGSVKGNTAYNTNTNGDDFVWPLAVGRGPDIPNKHVSVADNRSIDDRATKTHYNGLAVRPNTNGGWLTVHDNIVDGAVNAERDVDTSAPYLVYNGLGYNDGPPADGGQWIGEGFEGLMIRDTTSSDTYLYNGGVWSLIAST